MLKVLSIMCFLFTVLTASAGEFNVYGGVSITDKTNKGFLNPIGYLGVEYEHKYIEVYLEHISSIKNKKDAYGLNLLGINIKKTINDFEVYSGLGFRSRDIDFFGSGDVFSKSFNQIIPRAGIRWKYTYLEYFSDRFIGGLRIEY
jgi:hypothetical protein